MRRFSLIMVVLILGLIFLSRYFPDSPLGSMMSAASLFLIILLGIGIIFSSLLR